jgi:hypothetical protein
MFEKVTHMTTTTKTVRPSLKNFMEEEEARENLFDKANAPTPEKALATSIETARDKVPVAPAAVADLAVKKVQRGRGRPKSKPESRLASFHLPIALIDKLDAEAGKTTAGNKSLFIVTLLENYFSDK